MNWFTKIKTANSQLGLNLGKWLYLSHIGQNDPIAVQQDIRNYVTSNPLDLNPDEAYNTALSYFKTQTQQNPSDVEISLLNQWMTLLQSPASPEANLAEANALK